MKKCILLPGKIFWRHTEQRMKINYLPVMTTLRGPALQCSSRTLFAPIIVPIITPPSQLYQISSFILLELERWTRSDSERRQWRGDYGECANRCKTQRKLWRLDAASNRCLFGSLFLIFIGILEVYRLQTPHATLRKDRNAVSLRRALRAL